MLNAQDARALLEDVLSRARNAGADAADASIHAREGLSVEVRLAALEGVEREEGRSIALRAFVGKRQAAAASTDLSEAGRAKLAERVAAMARLAPEDPFCGLLEEPYRVSPSSLPDLELSDPSDPPDAEFLERVALEAEAAALSVAGVTNSNGAGANYDRGFGAYATHDGLFVSGGSTSFGVGVSPLAERDGQKERAYEGVSRRMKADLPSPAEIGAVAGRRAVAQLGSRKLDSRRAPVIFDNRVAGRLIGPFLGAISGPAVARGVSFLREKLGQQVFPRGFSLLEEPHLKRGLASRRFDAEGGVPGAGEIVSDGVLTTWLLNAASARQLGLAPNGRASGGHGGAPGVGTSNLRLPTRQVGGLAGLLKEAQTALYVDSMFSPSLNSNTGDWSVGVSGYWVEAGEVAFPTSEITVAGNLKDIYARLQVGDDVEQRGAMLTPSLLVDDLAIGGR